MVRLMIMEEKTSKTGFFRGFRILFWFLAKIMLKLAKKILTVLFDSLYHGSINIGARPCNNIVMPPYYIPVLQPYDRR
jgi:hypothetical protein